MDDLERIELSAVLDFFAAAPPEVGDAFDLAVFELSGPAGFSIGAFPSMLLFNRVLGLDDETRLPELEAWFDSRRCSFAISARPRAAIEAALVARGYRSARAFVKLRRGADQPPEPDTSLRIEQIDQPQAEDYGAIVATVFGIGSPLDRWFATLPTRAGWACFGAFDGDRLVGTGASYVVGILGWLGAAGTLPEARGRGAQSALLAARIRAAGRAGAQVLATEVERAGPSSRNVVRAGFEEAYVQEWWVRPEEAVSTPDPSVGATRSRSRGAGPA